jgi:DNA-binding transcriptional LysR family regulator
MLQQLLVFESNLKLLGNGCAGRLDMGMAPLMASQLVPRLTAQLMSASADIQLRVAVRPGEELLLALRSSEVEMIVYPERHLPETEEIDVQQLGLVQPTCVVRSGHPLCGRGALHIDDLSCYPWASSMETSLAPQVKSRSRLVCDNYHILRDAVVASDLVCICSQAFVADGLADGTLAEIVVTDLSLRPTKIFVARLKGRVHSPLASRALETICETLSVWWHGPDQVATVA